MKIMPRTTRAGAQVAHRVGDDADDEELDGQGVLEAPENLVDEALALLAREDVGTVGLEPFVRLLGAQSLARGVQEGQCGVGIGCAGVAEPLLVGGIRLGRVGGGQPLGGPDGHIAGEDRHAFPPSLL